MKQHITADQLNELSDKAKEKLREWWSSEGKPLLSIGQLIEFLDIYENNFEFEKMHGYWEIRRKLDLDYYQVKETAQELCDALWQAVKEVLENQEETTYL